jgi:H+/Cl- antiporter ClcA
MGERHGILRLPTHANTHLEFTANEFTATTRWGALVILVPVIGAVIVTFLVNNFAPEAKGHGVPEVMDAIYYREGVIRPIVAVVKSLASAVAIGSGSSVGREGPIIQIGSVIGFDRGTDHPHAIRVSGSHSSPRAPAPALRRRLTRRSAG